MLFDFFHHGGHRGHGEAIDAHHEGHREHGVATEFKDAAKSVGILRI